MKKVLSKVILVKMDAAKPETKKLSKEWKVKGLPGFVLLDGGQPAAVWVGYSKPDKWIKQLEKAMMKLPKAEP